MFILDPQKMNPFDFGDPLTFLLLSLWAGHFLFRSSVYSEIIFRIDRPNQLTQHLWSNLSQQMILVILWPTAKHSQTLTLFSQHFIEMIDTVWLSIYLLLSKKHFLLSYNMLWSKTVLRKPYLDLSFPNKYFSKLHILDLGFKPTT